MKQEIQEVWLSLWMTKFMKNKFLNWFFFFDRVFYQLILKAVKESSHFSKKKKSSKKHIGQIPKPTVHIPEVSVSIFKKLVHYIHTGRVDIKPYDLTGSIQFSLSLSLSPRNKKYKNLFYVKQNTYDLSFICCRADVCCSSLRSAGSDRNL